MRLHIIYKQSKGVSKKERHDDYDGDRATIGRGTDQTIALPGRTIPLEHSRLTLKEGQLRLTSVGGYSFSINGKPTRNTSLAPGDEINIGPHRLTIREGDDDNDFTVEVEPDTEEVESLREKFTTRLWQLDLHRRTFSWSLFAVVLAIGLIIPAAGFFVPEGFSMRDSPLPDDSMWLSGDLHETHAFMGDNCTYCHTKPFVPARDEDCLYCHLSVNHHFDTETMGRDYRIGDSCADCHREHNETGSIIRSDEEVCSVCHADLAAAGYESALEPATNFLEDHPPFKASIPVWNEQNGRFDTRRAYPWEESFVEESNLIFSHTVHLDEAGIESPEGEVVLECANCHQRQRDGLSMMPVTMEQHCSSCHLLTFDPTTPDRVVPHGSPPELMRMLREYYAYRFINPEQTADPQTAMPGTAAPTRRSARRPGHSEPTVISELILGEEELGEFSDQARTFIEERVNATAATLFEKQTCVQCHAIIERPDAEVPWDVQPVKVNQDWFPIARFDHESHKNMRCRGCHETADADSSAQILLPDIGTCRGCHGGAHAEDRLQSTCVTCHDFHLESQKPMGELITIKAGDAEAEAASMRMRTQ